MYQQYYRQEYEPIVAILGMALQLLLPILYIVVAYLVVKGAISYVVGLVSSESEREQQQRHRIKRLAGRIAVVCLIIGTVLSIGGMGEGTIDIILPSGIEINNAGVGVIFLGFMFAILYTLLREPTQKTETSLSTNVVSPVVSPPPSMDPRYVKAGVITLVRLPFLGPFAIVVGGILIWKVRKS